MKQIKKAVAGLMFLALFFACGEDQISKEEVVARLNNGDLFHQSLSHLTDVIVHDIFSPPVASRIYVYPCIAAYETLQQKEEDYLSLGNQLKGLTPFVSPEKDDDISYELASIYAFITTSQSLVFSEDKMVAYRKKVETQLDSLQIPPSIRAASLKHGNAVAKHILTWADKDNYKESRSFPKYTLSDEVAEWKPTPPSYMEAIEPHWNKIRTMVLSSADQFKPQPPTTFDLKKGSPFYQELMQVYETVKEAKEEEIAIASFWDCNPYVMNQTGHMMFATKKITPGGHWMGISNIASKTADHSLIESIETSTKVSIALFDAFISCWDEKYRSKLIRPETLINKHIDDTWKPILQTPPFPEHTSGHSVISSAAAHVLTDLLGDSFKYTDDVEVKYGLPSRDFNSFTEASDQAAISRLYGGIHYMPAIEYGVTQGKNVGAYQLEKLSFRVKK